jgi:nucleotide-binding universal stress UspA family protein
MKILLATDGSSHARIAENILLKLPRWREAEILVVSVASPGSGEAATVEPVNDIVLAQESAAAFEVAESESAATAQRVAARLQAAGVNARSMVLHGEVATELLDCAERERADVVALGSRGMGAFKSFFLGSVTRRLLNHSPVTLLIGRAFEDETEAESAARLEGKEKLTAAVCVDGSRGGDLALDRLCEQGAGAFAKAIAFCAEPLSVLPPGVNPSDFGSTYKYDHERAEQIVREAATKLQDCADEAVGGTVLGRPGTVLPEAAKQYDVDLLALGATRHGALERFLVGSVSYEIATSAHCSVLVVRPGV